MSIPSFLKGQIFITPPLPTQTFIDQTIIVTGANTGLGLDCAKHLVRLNAAHLILACRNIEKGEAAKAKILETAPTCKTSIEVWPLDLSKYNSVISFAQRCESLERLDAVVENAGISSSRFAMAERDEATLTVNVVSTALLTVLLLPKLQESAAKYGLLPKISVVNSFVHALAKTKDLDAIPEGQLFKTLSDEKKADMADRYYLSKLLILFFNRELSSRIRNSAKSEQIRVVINNPAPGWAKTGLFREEYQTWRLPRKLAFKAMGRTSEIASRCLVHGITVGTESQGEWLSDCRIQLPSAFVRSDKGTQMQLRIWSELSEKLERIFPQAGKIMARL